MCFPSKRGGSPGHWISKIERRTFVAIVYSSFFHAKINFAKNIIPEYLLYTVNTNTWHLVVAYKMYEVMSLLLTAIHLTVHESWEAI